MAPDPPVATYRHTYRLFAVLGTVLVIAVIARFQAVPASFGERGHHFRGDAAREAQTIREPRLQGRQSCVECHKFQSQLAAKDVHRSVQCEDCHGPGKDHVKDPTAENIATDRSRDACLVCHRLLEARPGAFPQVAWKDHFQFVGAKDDDKTRCIDCHDAHEPLFLEKPLSEARMHPLIHRCRDCHTGKISETEERPANHPAIFECSYCHAAKVKDFEKRTHADIKCTTCHLFVKESDFAGRIVKNDDPRFCLLCHGKNDIRSAKSTTPTISWPEHLKDVHEEKGDESTPCVGCHAAVLHGEPGSTPRVGGAVQP